MGLFLVVAALAFAAYVWLRIAQARSAEGDEEERRRGFRRMLARDPSNIGAHEALADSLRRAGRLTEARDEYLQALACCTGDLTDAQIRYKVRQVELSMQDRRASGPFPERDFILCPRCGGTNLPDHTVCETCQATMPYRTFREALRDKAVLHAAAESASCALVLAVVCFVFQSMPLDVEGVLVMAAIIVIAWRFVQALGPRRV